MLVSGRPSLVASALVVLATGKEFCGRRGEVKFLSSSPEELNFDGCGGGNGGTEGLKLWSIVFSRGRGSLVVEPPLVFM